MRRRETCLKPQDW